MDTADELEMVAEPQGKPGTSVQPAGFLLELSLESDALFVARDEPVGLVEITVERDLL